MHVFQYVNSVPEKFSYLLRHIPSPPSPLPKLCRPFFRLYHGSTTSNVSRPCLIKRPLLLWSLRSPVLFSFPISSDAVFDTRIAEMRIGMYAICSASSGGLLSRLPGRASYNHLQVWRNYHCLSGLQETWMLTNIQALRIQAKDCFLHLPSCAVHACFYLSVQNSVHNMSKGMPRSNVDDERTFKSIDERALSTTVLWIGRREIR